MVLRNPWDFSLISQQSVGWEWRTTFRRATFLERTKKRRSSSVGVKFISIGFRSSSSLSEERRALSMSTSCECADIKWGVTANFDCYQLKECRAIAKDVRQWPFHESQWQISPLNFWKTSFKARTKGRLSFPDFRQWLQASVPSSSHLLQ